MLTIVTVLFKLYFFLYTCAKNRMIDTNEHVNSVQNWIQKKVIVNLVGKVKDIYKYE